MRNPSVKMTLLLILVATEFGEKTGYADCDNDGLESHFNSLH